MSEEKEEYQPVEAFTTNHHACYQIQVIDDVCKPVFLGMYEDIPLHVIKTMKYKKYVCYVVAYILSKEEVDNKLYKIAGINILRQNRKTSLYSLDYVYNSDNNAFELILCDHVKDSVEIIEKMDTYIGKDKLCEYMVIKLFQDPVQQIFFK